MIDYGLNYSLANRKIIYIIYMKGIEITQRKIQVLKIEGESIKALDIDKGEIRTFKKSNILSAMDLRLIDNNKGHERRQLYESGQ